MDRQKARARWRRHKNSPCCKENTLNRFQRDKAAVLAYKLDNPCVDCGEADPIVLDFDHRGDKVCAVSQMSGRGWSLRRLFAEIAKCDVRCANCHRRKTAIAQEWFRG